MAWVCRVPYFSYGSDVELVGYRHVSVSDRTETSSTVVAFKHGVDTHTEPEHYFYPNTGVYK